LDIRRSAYLDLFAGAFGHTYGCHDVWQMYNPQEESINGAQMYWYDAIDLPAANQMKYVRHLMEAFPMLERVPDQTILKDINTAAAERVQATRGTDYLMVYSTAGKPFTVNMGKINGKMVKGFWYNPRKGEKIAIDVTANTGLKQFTPPSEGYSQDWVLVLFDSARSYDVENHF